MYDRVPTKVAARELVSSPVLMNTVKECVYSMQTGGRTADAKVTQLDLALCVDKNVRRLDIWEGVSE